MILKFFNIVLTFLSVLYLVSAFSMRPPAIMGRPDTMMFDSMNFGPFRNWGNRGFFPGQINSIVDRRVEEQLGKREDQIKTVLNAYITGVIEGIEVARKIDRKSDEEKTLAQLIIENSAGLDKSVKINSVVDEEPKNEPFSSQFRDGRQLEGTRQSVFFSSPRSTLTPFSFEQLRSRQQEFINNRFNLVEPVSLKVEPQFSQVDWRQPESTKSSFNAKLVRPWFSVDLPLTAKQVTNSLKTLNLAEPSLSKFEFLPRPPFDGSMKTDYFTFSSSDFTKQKTFEPLQSAFTPFVIPPTTNAETLDQPIVTTKKPNYKSISKPIFSEFPRDFGVHLEAGDRLMNSELTSITKSDEVEFEPTTSTLAAKVNPLVTSRISGKPIVESTPTILDDEQNDIIKPFVEVSFDAISKNKPSLSTKKPSPLSLVREFEDNEYLEEPEETSKVVERT